MSKSRKSFSVAVASMAAILFLNGAAAPIVSGQTVNQWTNGGADNLWKNAANWSLGHIPTASEDSEINNGDIVNTGSTSPSITGTVNIKGGTVTFSAQDNYISSGTENSAIINQSGGSVIVSNAINGGEAWFNIGESSAYGYYNLSGGTLDASKTNYFCLGRYGKGYMTVSGESTEFIVNTMWLGFSASGSVGSKLTIEDGTVTFKGSGLLGYGTSTEAQKTSTELKGGTLVVASSGNLTIGYKGAHEFIQTGGKINATGGVIVAQEANSWGNLIINDGTNEFVNLSLGAGTGKITINGGTSTITGSLSMGASLNSNLLVTGGNNTISTLTFSSGSGTANLSGGTNTITNLQFDSGSGTANLSGGTNNTITNLTFGSGIGTVNLSGGTNMISTLGYTENVTTGTGKVFMSGGSLTFSGALNLSGSNNTQFNVSGGAATFSDAVNVSSTGTTQFQVSGNANVTIKGALSAGSTSAAGEQPYSVVFSGGTTTLEKSFSIGSNSSDNPAKLLISDSATVKFSGNDSFVGSSSGAGYYYQTGGTVERTSGASWFNVSGDIAAARGYAYISGGTLKLNAADLCVGRYAQGVMEISGTGTSVSASTLYLGFAPYKTEDSSLVVKEGGLLSLSGGAFIGGDNTSKHSEDAKTKTTTLTIDGGAVKIAGAVKVGGLSNGQPVGTTVLNITGSSNDTVPMSVGSLAVENGATINFFLSGFKVSNEGAATASAIVSSGDARVSGAVTVDTTDYSPAGAVNFFGSPSFSLINASSVTWSPSSVTVSGPWKVDVDETLGDIDLTLDSNQCASVDFSTGKFVESALGDSGWVLLTGDANSINSARLIYSGGTQQEAALLADYITDNSATGISASVWGDYLEIAGLKLDDQGVGSLFLNIQPFNNDQQTHLAFSNVPEPTSGALLFLSVLVGSWFVRRKRAVGAVAGR